MARPHATDAAQHFPALAPSLDDEQDASPRNDSAPGHVSTSDGHYTDLIESGQTLPATPPNSPSSPNRQPTVLSIGEFAPSVPAASIGIATYSDTATDSGQPEAYEQEKPPPARSELLDCCLLNYMVPPIVVLRMAISHQLGQDRRIRPIS
jgi:hypothetical protein